METNQIICGDNVEVLSKFPAGCIDLVVTSPPYGRLRKYDTDPTWNLAVLVVELKRVLKNGGVIIWVVGDQTFNGSESGDSFRQALRFMESGFNLHDTMIYQKNSYMPLTHNRYEQGFEYMFAFSKGRPKTWNPIMVPCTTAGTKRNRAGSKAQEPTYAERRRDETTLVNDHKQHSNIFVYDVGKNDKTIHNAPFPVQLVKDQIASWSDPGDLVLDPFCGSGTTCIAAIELGREWIGIEINQEYCSVAERRINTVRAK